MFALPPFDAEGIPAQHDGKVVFGPGAIRGRLFRPERGTDLQFSYRSTPPCSSLGRLTPCILVLSALRVKIRDKAVVRSKAVYLAHAVLPDGSRDVLGIWIEQTEGAKFWMKVFTDLKTRGCQDVLIAVTDGLKGMSEALAAVYPATTLQTCIVHLLRNSLDFANWKERKPLAAALRPIYTAASADAALLVLDAFEHGPWD
jgi:putative transposase